MRIMNVLVAVDSYVNKENIDISDMKINNDSPYALVVCLFVCVFPSSSEQFSFYLSQK
jgi:hypothetical protein